MSARYDALASSGRDPWSCDDASCEQGISLTRPAAAGAGRQPLAKWRRREAPRPGSLRTPARRPWLYRVDASQSKRQPTCEPSGLAPRKQASAGRGDRPAPLREVGLALEGVAIDRAPIPSDSVRPMRRFASYRRRSRRARVDRRRPEPAGRVAHHWAVHDEFGRTSNAAAEPTTAGATKLGLRPNLGEDASTPRSCGTSGCSARSKRC
jgi:hypothetical protein